MTVKVTKPGQSQFKGRCHKCGCEFTYEISDVGANYTALAMGEGLHCPSCGQWHYHGAWTNKQKKGLLHG